MSGQDPHARLTDLETRLAYQDDTLDKLDAVIAGQARRIARLESALERLAQRLEAAQRPEPAETTDERPPHY